MFSFFLVFKLYKSSLQIIDITAEHLIYLGSINIGSYLVVAYFEKWVLTLAHFSNVFFWSVSCKCQTCVWYKILDMENVSFESF